MPSEENNDRMNIEHTDEGSHSKVNASINTEDAPNTKTVTVNNEIKTTTMSENEIMEQNTNMEIQGEPKEKKTMKEWLKSVAWGAIIYYTTIGTIVLLFSIFAIAGFAGLNFEYASFYYNALRCLDDEEIAMQTWVSLDIDKSTMKSKSENRYFDQMQSSNAKKGACMAGSWYTAPYLECFPITQKYNYRCYESDEMVQLDVDNAKNRFIAINTLFDNKCLNSWLVNDQFTKVKQIPDVDQTKMDAFNQLRTGQVLSEWAKKLMTLVDGVIVDFKKMHSKTADSSYTQKYYVEEKDGKIVASADLSSAIEGIMDAMPTKKNMAKGGKEDMSVESLLRGFTRLGKAKPVILDSLAIGKIYNWAIFMHSTVTFDDLSIIKAFKKKQEDYVKAAEEFDKQNPNATPKEKKDALSKNMDQLNSWRSIYIARAISMVISNLFKSQKLTQQKKFPFSKEKDPRNGFVKAFSCQGPKETTEDSLSILKAIFKDDFAVAA